MIKFNNAYHPLLLEQIVKSNTAPNTRLSPSLLLFHHVFYINFKHQIFSHFLSYNTFKDHFLKLEAMTDLHILLDHAAQFFNKKKKVGGLIRSTKTQLINLK